MKNSTGPNPLPNPQPGHREIRSFVLREGRLTKGQAFALKELWPRYGVEDSEGVLDPLELFGRTGPLIVEIGFGNGEALVHAATQSPDELFVGIEVHRPGVGSLMLRLKELALDNVRILCADASQVLEHRVADHSLAGLRLYFPDPWPKKRHHKRRIVQPGFVERVFGKLAPGGLFHLATDWENYAEHMLEVIKAHGGFVNESPLGEFVVRPTWRPQTRFERRGLRLGHGVWDLLYSKPAG